MDAFSDNRMLAALEAVAPGTELREALDYVIAANTGALVVLGDEAAVDRLCNGGFVLSSAFTPQRMFELAKMDGAIILDEGCTTILKANVHLVPDPKLPTSETGMRHRTAERVSRQTSALVISVSQRRDHVTLYRGGDKVLLEPIEVVLAKANQALMTLQRFRSRLDEASDRLTALEFDDAVTLGDAVSALQAQLMVQRVAREVGRYITELGREGRLVGLQSGELTASVEEDHMMLLRDYVVESGTRKASVVRSTLSLMTGEQVLDAVALAQTLGFPASGDVLEIHVRPRGYRVLRRIPMLPGTVANRLVDRFGSLAGLLEASEAQLDDVDGVGARRARAIRDAMHRIRRHSQM
ncbi:MAG TPA: DNA integrity scanning diadenylate cyclase DisA [Coriobacteriia bacterium]